MIRTILLLLMLTVLTACSEFALLMSVGGGVATQNAYVRAYNGADFLTVVNTDKSIKRHVYDKGKEYIYDQTMGLIND